LERGEKAGWIAKRDCLEICQNKACPIGLLRERLTMRKQRNRKSPLGEKPLRNPGQSADEAVQDLLFEKIILPFIYIVTLLLFLGMEWRRYYRPLSHAPVLDTIFLGLIALFLTYRIFRGLRDLQNYKLGRDGEKAVGHGLEELRISGYSILHDILGEGFNLDHVVFSNRGLFVIETKSLRKPLKGDAIIAFEGETLLANGRKLDRDPVKQALAEVNWLKGLLKKITGEKFPVKGIIAFPGWFVTPMPNYLKEKVWVLNPKNIASFISQEREQLNEEKAHMAVYYLSQYVRSSLK
jgi:hypothetical protein